MIALLEYRQAAAHCGVPLSYFRNLVKGGVGPNCVLPSPKKVMFRVADLDRWIASWVERASMTKHDPMAQAAGVAGAPRSPVDLGADCGVDEFTLHELSANPCTGASRRLLQSPSRLSEKKGIARENKQYT
jgi:hypothetical protein